EFVREALAPGQPRWRLVRPVVLVLQTQHVPVDGRFEMALVDSVHEDFRPLPYLQRRSWDRSVVGEHADAVAPDLLGDRSDAELELVPVRELDDVRPLSVLQAL